MKIGLIILAIGWAVWVVYMIYLIQNAPEGYEKDGKFHYGKEPTQD
jgi:hypothetical protein